MHRSVDQPGRSDAEVRRVRTRKVPVGRGRLLAPAALTLALAGCAAVLFGRLLPAAGIRTVADVAQLTASGAAAACCVRAARRARSTRERRSWLLFAAGTGSWAAGQAVWSYFE